jgi:hypothetical protein
MTTPHDQYYDEDRRRWPEFDTDDYTDPDDSMSLQDLARGARGYDEDMNRDFSEEAYNEWLMNGGDL